MPTRPVRMLQFEAVELETDELAVVVVPELGGKIASLVHRPSGFQFAYLNPNTGLVRYPYDAPYRTTDCGIGDLFPSIGVGLHGDGPWKGIPLPDKGELWTQPMDIEVLEGRVRTSCTGVRFPYRFTRWLTVEGSELRLSYEVENLCGFDLRYQWSLQPHLRLDGRSRLRVPPGAVFYVDWSRNGDFEPRHPYRWPTAARRPRAARPGC